MPLHQLGPLRIKREFEKGSLLCMTRFNIRYCLSADKGLDYACPQSKYIETAENPPKRPGPGPFQRQSPLYCKKSSISLFTAIRYFSPGADCGKSSAAAGRCGVHGKARGGVSLREACEPHKRGEAPPCVRLRAGTEHDFAPRSKAGIAAKTRVSARIPLSTNTHPF